MRQTSATELGSQLRRLVPLLSFDCSFKAGQSGSIICDAPIEFASVEASSIDPEIDHLSVVALLGILASAFCVHHDADWCVGVDYGRDHSVNDWSVVPMVLDPALVVVGALVSVLGESIDN